MPGRTRLVLPGVAHHVLQRGSRRQRVFFGKEDYRRYLRMLQVFSRRAKTSILGYCLMPNHVHVVAVPTTEEGLRTTFAPLHRSYAQEINQRQEWSGHLWEGRFKSFPMDDPHTQAVLRYVDQNPLRAGMINHVAEYPYSSARAHLGLEEDPLVDLQAFLSYWDDDFRQVLEQNLDEEQAQELRKAVGSPWPMGSSDWVDRLEAEHGRQMRPSKRGPTTKP